ncbi:MAG: TonB-dependent receptor plug domain-containing protein [Bacteroidetes bacterium]|nr:TonB-dependent receptor plug domain-containing protein [Bacteroidota bacterium]
MKKVILLIVIVSSFFSFAREDEDLLKQLVSKLEKYNQTHPQEKAYLHTDKPYYVAGEKLWFKTYLVEGMTNRPDTVSIPLYVDLIDNAEGKLIDRRIIKLEGGFGHGDFTLPDSLLAGFYRLRAYTNWMRNFDESQYFIKDFQVYSIEQDSLTDKLYSAAIDFQFFPEGGNLIAGLDTRIAFKATDGAGKGLAISGEIIASTGDTVQRFKSEHQGMGFFYFKPDSGLNYHAIIKYRDNYAKTFDLPQVQVRGVSMMLDNFFNKNNIRLILNSTLDDSEMLIIGQSKGVVFYAGKVAAGKTNIMTMIPKDKFPPGVAQFTVFDNQFRPHAERLVFIQPDQELIFAIKPDKNTFETREKTTLEIEVKDNRNNPVEGNFSLVVTDENQVKGLDEQETILTNLLLSSDVRGNIENPNYYLDKDNPKRQYHLDILLMTQGWRRFKWQDALQAEPQPTRYFLERGLTIAGKVTKLNGKAFNKVVSLTMVLGRDSTQQFLMGEAEKNGSLMFHGLDFKDSCEVMLQAMIDDDNPESKLTITQQPPPLIRKNSSKNWFLEEKEVSFGLASYLRYTKEALELQKQTRFDKAILLNEVTVKSKKYVPLAKDPRVWYSRPDYVLTKFKPSAISIYDILRGQIAGLSVSTDVLNPSITIRGAKPLYLVDGMPSDAQRLLLMDVSNVEKIEVIKGSRGAIFYGNEARFGIVSILTKTGNMNYDYSKEPTDGIKVLKVPGYYTSKEFFVPRYDQNLPENIRPDYRSTVFWSPIIRTGKDGKAKVSFFNTDAETTMRVGMEGLAYNGLMGSGKTTYSVKK